MLRRLAFHVVAFSVIRAVSLKPSAVGEHDAKTTLHGTSSLRSSEEQAAHQYYMATGRFPPWFRRQDGVEADGHMHVVYALEATSKVLKAALVSMVTLGRHLKEPHLLTIHVIGDNVEVIEKELVACFFNFMGDQAAPHVELHELHDLPDVMLQFAHRTLPPQGHVQMDMDGFERRTRLRMSRFYLHQYLPPSASRALWLDAETFVVADIMPLRRLEMKTAVAAVQDGTGLEDETAFLRQASANFSQAQSFIPAPGAHHFKTSVLLVDLGEWRRRQLHRELEALAALVKDHRTVDRLLLNLGLHSQFDMLNERWNAECIKTETGAADILKSASILHCEVSQQDGRDKLPKGLWRLYDECGRCISGQLVPTVPHAASAVAIGAAGNIIRAER